jgi:hypothetical protein
MKWIYHYRCGCSDGPKKKGEMLDYCGIHGDDLMDKYPIPDKARDVKDDSPLKVTSRPDHIADPGKMVKP